jgi:hypothetical protein
MDCRLFKILVFMRVRCVLVCDLDISADDDMALIKCMMWDGVILHVTEDVFTAMS